jgi:tetrahydromethanopterin S-methyltransferase subunit G
MQQSKEDLSLGELFADLSRETSTLVRKEVELAKTELTQRAARIGKDIGFMAIGGALAYAGLFFILATVAIVLITLGVPPWLSVLLVGLVAIGAGYFLIQKGRSALKKDNLAPSQTIETLKEDAEWAKQQIG